MKKKSKTSKKTADSTSLDRGAARRPSTVALSKDIVDTCYVIGPSSRMQLLFKQLKAQWNLLQNDSRSFDVERLKETLSLATSVASHTHFLYLNRQDLEDEADVKAPCEVAAWLKETFPRHRETEKVVLDPNRTKFSSVQGPDVYGVNERTQQALDLVNDISFDIFFLERASPNQAFRHVVRRLMYAHNFLSLFKIPVATLENFITSTEAGYRLHKNPYHNDLHAADVAQTLNALIIQTDYISYLSELEAFTCLFAAIIHDYEHTGTTNTFHINTSSELALLYNDRAVLENFHISRIFRKMREDPSTNILANLSHADFTEVRCNSIDLVLATDMNFHFAMIKNLADTSSLTTTQLMGGLLHFADISHPAKDFSIHSVWVKRLFQEFFKQGDTEKKLGMVASPLCDRVTTMLPESQLGFIDLIILPTVNVLFDALPASAAYRSVSVGRNISFAQMTATQKVKTIIRKNIFTNRLIWTKKINQGEDLKDSLSRDL